MRSPIARIRALPHSSGRGRRPRKVSWNVQHHRHENFRLGQRTAAEDLSAECRAINALEPEIAKLTDAELRARTDEFRARLEAGEKLDNLLVPAFATVREAAKRVLGQRHFDVQLIGGMVLHEGAIAEMRTGEGKTLVATLAAYLNALPRTGVHVVTVNDYLARRDAEWMGRIYNFLGLSVGTIVHGKDDPERREAYAADITYGTNNEFGFDYLRDNMKYELAHMVQRGHKFAIVDEVDSILIDEARTPLIISGPSDDKSDLYNSIDKIIPRLGAEDFELDEKQRAVNLTEAGNEHIEELLAEIGVLEEGSLYDAANVTIVHHVNQALRAHKLFQRDKDYIVRNGEVVIIDEFTGRMMPGRRYSEGLHQALEAKERVQVQPENATLASITFQNYFRLYGKLSGMTGTAVDGSQRIRRDLQARRGRDSDQPAGAARRRRRRSLSHRRRKARGDRAGNRCRQCETAADAGRHDFDREIRAARRISDQAAAINRSISPSRPRCRSSMRRRAQASRRSFSPCSTRASTSRRPISSPRPACPARSRSPPTWPAAAPTFSLAATSRCASRRNAPVCREGPERDAKEAEIRAEVARFHERAIAAGGLYIIGTERHESRRIDNQLRGRSGRQGDPGRSKFFLSLKDDLMRIFGSDRMDSMLVKLGLKEGEAIVHPWINKALEKAQQKVEARNFDMRKNILKYDNVMNDQRKVVFEQRREMMAQTSLEEMITDMRQGVVEDIVAKHAPPDAYPEAWDIEGLTQAAETTLNITLPFAEWAQEEGITDDDLRERIQEAADEAYAARVEKNGPDLMRYVEKQIVLQALDHLWREHLATLDHLRQVIGWRGMAQRDPLNEYKSEAFELFSELITHLRETTTAQLNRVEVAFEPPEPAPPLQTANFEALNNSAGLIEALTPAAFPRETQAFAPERQAAAQPAPQPERRSVPARVAKDPSTWGKVGRNEPCPCGSGKKYKHCHGAIG